MPYDTSGEFYGKFVRDPKFLGKYHAADLVSAATDPSYVHTTRRNAMIDHYDGCIRFVDDCLRRMVDALKRENAWDSTLFVVLADHGENIGDHGFVNHQLCLYDTVIRVPLIVHFPDAFEPGSVEPHPVQCTDVLPATLRILGRDPANIGIGPQSLLQGETKADRALFLEHYIHTGFRGGELLSPKQRAAWADPRLKPYNRRIKAVVDGAWKLISGSDGVDELYNRAEDPGELNNLAAKPETAEKLAALRAQLAPLIAADKTFRDSEVDVDAEMLEALGYL